ncbi:uncharacterized protein LOC127935946 [Carassius gibelio]|uniref:uncharacterized protein LOC127935946 n=1 Tax=Carassius gibelio TaxID=101364 RepID=UPI0022788FE9|nr:uncharacterized protein LOC127935946 [Carassius gibelio]
MFATMAVHHLFVSFILLLISNTGSSAEISVFVQTGDSVQLEIQTQELPEFDLLSWSNDKSESIVTYTSETKRVRLYKDRVDLNDKTFSLTLKNTQKTDSGLYTAKTSGESNKNIVTYRVSVIDAVEAPVLTVISNRSSSDSCTVNFRCRTHELKIDSSYQNNSCLREEVTSQINTLILFCSEESIICNHSNPVSWKEDRINVTQLCEGFSAEISVFVQTGDSVQLEIQTQELPEFDDLSWSNDKSESIVRYTSETKRVKLHSSYKDRVDLNAKTFSLTLKNIQKIDSGLYTARTSGESNKNIVTYRVSVIDAVEAPVLTVNSNRSSSDSCTVNFTCRTHELKIDSSYQNNRCSPQEVTSQINTLILDCREESIICNHSNPVSWKEDRINITQLCEGFSAEISVFVQTGDSVQLEIQTQQLPEFDLLSWSNDKSENIVRYTSETKRVKLHSSYKDRVDLNAKTFSLTLKNIQKTDSGLYTARTSGESNKNIVTYRVSVIDAVEAPVLTVISNLFSSDSCTVNFTCRTHELKIDSSYQNNRCSPQEVTSQINTLILFCSEESIICNHSNPVSWKEDRINITQLCEGSSAEISVFVQTGDSVQLEIQTQELPEFDLLFWSNDKSENIVTYTSETKRVRLYNDRVDLNDKTFSLTLKNIQKTDSGLYTARTSGESNKNIVTYRVSVIDAVEAPVLTVISNLFSSDSCTVNFTCRTHELKIDSSYQNNRCSPQEVTSQINTLILDCREESIICNHSNPVSWKEDRINITQLCEDNDRRFPLSHG